MARLVAVCRDGEEEMIFDKRQMPLYIDDTLTMVVEFSDMLTHNKQIDTLQLKQFIQRHSMLQEQDLRIALMVTSQQLFNELLQLVPCVGCRRSVERLFTQLIESGNPALDPLSVGTKGVLTLLHSCMTDATKLYTLFYVCGTKLSSLIQGIPKSKKNKRCQLHSLDTHKPKPLGGNWMDIWEVMSQECRNEVVLIDSSCLLETLENYLRRHRFCTDCKNKVLRAFNILIGELDYNKEKDYCAALYEGLRCCPRERHIHVCSETDVIAHLLSRAEPEFAGGRRERHAKTIDIAQEEVLICLGIHLYERLHRIWQKLRGEEQTWQMLYYLGVDALHKNFEMTVEKVQGISRLEQLCEEFLEEERILELKQEKKRQKKKNRRKNKWNCDLTVSEEVAEIAVASQKNVPLGFIGNRCNSCNASEDNSDCVEIAKTNESCTCGGDLLTSTKTKTVGNLAPLSNGSDWGYSSSMEGSETGSREGSDVACIEGICNHDEAGEDSCVNCGEEDDSCVECWTNSSKDNLKGKKKKCKPFKCETEHVTFMQNTSSKHDNQFSSIENTKQTWVNNKKELYKCKSSGKCLQSSGIETKSLQELLDESDCTSEEEDCLSQDEIQAFMTSNQSFYSNRQQFRLYLKEKFNKYCLLHDHS